MLLRQPLFAQQARPCSPLPWGTVSALNLATGKLVWQTPLGTELPNAHTGTWNVGGPVTAGGLVFTAASTEAYLRAFDSATGEELWKGAMPAPPQATRCHTCCAETCTVIPAGGHPEFGTKTEDQPGTKTNDQVVVFALP